MRRVAIFLSLLLVAGALLSGCGDPPPEPPDVPSSGQRLFLERGLIEVDQGGSEEPYYVETPSGARIPAPEPPAHFTIAVGADEVTVVQAKEGLIWVWANDSWMSITSDEQTTIRPGQPPDTPVSIDQYLNRQTYLADPVLGE